MNQQPRRRGRVLCAVLAIVTATALAVPTAAAAAPAPAAAPARSAPAATASMPPLTNLAHLDFLLDEATPPADVPGHTTYRLAEEPTLVMPWTYADARDGGTFERVGGGPLDPATGYWGQGAYNADDISRAAVVYLRHWELTGEASSRDSAYELLRALAYLQTTEGPNAGNVVLWMQPDGTLNPSPEPVELPDPSDSGPSYWLARTIWAFGEGYAAFAGADPAFAAFLDERLTLAVDAVTRQELVDYGVWTQADGMRVPAWLIVDGADASAEAVLGLAARVESGGAGAQVQDALSKLAEGIAAMGADDQQSWPYGAVLPWALSRSMWHAWGSQMPAALAVASETLSAPSLLAPAVRDAASFTTTLLTAGGPDNGWFPTPADRVQIAYGADSRVQSLLAVADATGSTGFDQLAAVQAAWFFGANRAGVDMYIPATGVTYDGLQPDGSVNRNSGAESTIHGLLTMIALDAHPALAARATSVTDVADRDGLRVVEAETATTDGTVITPEAWTGESLWSGGGLALATGQHAAFTIGVHPQDRIVQPVVWSAPDRASSSTWRAERQRLGELRETAPAQGISPTPGVLLPRSLERTVRGKQPTVQVEVTSGTLQLDALLIRPVVSRLVLTGEGRTELVHSASTRREPVVVGVHGERAVAYIYDAQGRLTDTKQLRGDRTIVLPAGGFALLER